MSVKTLRNKCPHVRIQLGTNIVRIFSLFVSHPNQIHEDDFTFIEVNGDRVLVDKATRDIFGGHECHFLVADIDKDKKEPTIQAVELKRVPVAELKEVPSTEALEPPTPVRRSYSNETCILGHDDASELTTTPEKPTAGDSADTEITKASALSSTDGLECENAGDDKPAADAEEISEKMSDLNVKSN